VIGTMSVADRRERDDPPPEGVSDRRELGVGRMLGLVGGERSEHQDRRGDRRDLPEARREPSQPRGGEQDPDDARESGDQQDRRAAGHAGDQVEREREQHDAQVEPAAACVQIVGHDPALHHEVDDEHEPGPDADDDLDPFGLR
jgi:hypothetical protein